MQKFNVDTGVTEEKTFGYLNDSKSICDFDASTAFCSNKLQNPI